jgi:DNA-binding beta-propeller fold protein YncE
MALSSDGYLYVSDQNNYRIVKYTTDGDFVTAWGSEGSGPGQFERPTGMCVDVDGNVYVADQLNRRVQVFDSSGNFIRELGTRGVDAGILSQPRDVGIDPQGFVEVVDQSNRIVVYTRDTGLYVSTWGEDHRLSNPSTIAFDDQAYIYVGSEGGAVPNRLSRWTGDHHEIAQWGTIGTAPGQLNFPAGICVGLDGNVYEADFYNQRIQVFSPTGALLDVWTELNSGTAFIDSPVDIAADRDGFIYVLSMGSSTVMKLTPGVVLVRRASWGELKSRYR